MRSPRIRRVCTWSVLVACWAGATGCTHNYYYGALPACAPSGPVVSTQVGSVCEVPSTPAPIVSSSSPSPGASVRTNVSNALASIGSNPQKVVISQPTYGPSSTRGLGRFNNWHRPDPEGVATIRSEGGLNDETIQR